MIVRELFARLGLDLDEGGFRRAEAAIAGLRAGLLGVGAAVGAAAVGVAALVKSTADAGSEVAKTSQKLGLGREALQEWQHAAEMSGVGTEELEHGLRHLALAAYNASHGSAEAVVAFRQLGVQFRDGSGKVRPLAALLGDLNARFAAMPDSTQKVALAQHLFGRGGAAMLPMLNRTTAAVAELKKEAHDLGLVLSDQVIEDAREFTRVSRLSTAALRGLGYAIGGPLLKGASSLAEAFARWVATHREWIASRVHAAVDLLRLAASKLLQLARPWIDLFVSLATNSVVVKGALLALALVAGGLLGQALVSATGAVLRLGAALVALGIRGLIAAAVPTLIGLAWLALAALIALVAEDIYGFFKGKDSLTGSLVEKTKEAWQRFRSWISEKLGAIADELTSVFGAAVDVVIQRWKAAFLSFKQWLRETLLLGGPTADVSDGSGGGKQKGLAELARSFVLGPVDALLSGLFGGGAASPSASVARSAGAPGTQTFLSPLSINVNAAPGQSAEDIAAAVRREIEDFHQTTLREAAAAAGIR